MAKTFNDIPLIRPKTPLLSAIEDTFHLRELDEDQLLELADELRAYLLFSVGKSGGHFGAGLGTVELTIALHYIFNTPRDRLVWDVGHQAYPHKILTGRRDQMPTIRQAKGLSAFPKRDESEYDTFGVGHSSTSISAALGMALGSAMNGEDKKTVAVIGDGAMTAGMAFEALNHTAHTDADLLVVLNDNNMSISHNVGGLATYFSKIWSRKTEEHLKAMVAPGIVFEELGFNYIGPIDGHNLPLLVQTLRNLKALSGPILLHTITQKGKGFAPAEADPVGYHALNKIEPKNKPKVAVSQKAANTKKYLVTGFVIWRKKEPRLVGITPANVEARHGNFAKRFPVNAFMMCHC
ncbi:UNVERIFIED_CONTAM: hypothetical protein GTU68_061564 [Idotea baltica]|nr:hypothetical protein [Idotea baltica]